MQSLNSSKQHCLMLCACLIILSGTSLAWAQEWGRQLIGDRLGGLKPDLSYESFYAPEKGIKDSSRELGYLRQRGNFFLPVTQSPNHEMTLSFFGDWWSFGSSAVLPHSGTPFPDELWSPGVIAFYRQKRQSGSIWGARLQISSPSDKPFGSFDEVALRGLFFYRWPMGAKSAWYFFVSGSNTSTIFGGAPFTILPGAAYTRQWNDHWRLFLGLPFLGLSYQPRQGLWLRLNYLIPRSLHAHLGWRFNRNLGIQVGFDWDHDEFLRADRQDRDFKLFYYRKQAVMGLTLSGRNLRLSLNLAYAFDRFWFEAEEYDDRDRDRIDLEDGLVYSLRLVVTF